MQQEAIATLVHHVVSINPGSLQGCTCMVCRAKSDFVVCCMAQSQFGVGLREAAHNLRICPTTLKRACRRHGIYRWPRRQSWAGGGGDDCRTDSMNLDGDFLYPAGVTTGPEPPSSAAPLSALGTACCTTQAGVLLIVTGAPSVLFVVYTIWLSFPGSACAAAERHC